MSALLPFGPENAELVDRLREKREFVRVSVPVSVAYRHAGGDGELSSPRPAMMSCLSLTGARVLTTEEIEPGSELRLEMPIPSIMEWSTAVGQVLRCFPAEENGRFSVSLFFTRVASDDVRRIGAFLEERVEVEQLQNESLVLRLKLLQDLAQVLHATMDPERILVAVVDMALELVDAESGSLLLLNPESERLEFAVARGPKADQVHAYTLAQGEGIAGWVALSGRPVIVDDPSDDSRWRSEIASDLDYPTESLAAAPLKLQEQPIGVLEVMNKKGGKRFDTADIRLMEALAAQAAIIIENSRLYNELQASASLARKRLREAADKLTVWKRAAEANMTQAAVSMPVSTGEFLLNESAAVLLENLGDLRGAVEERLREILEDVRSVAPAATRTSGCYLVHAPDTDSPILMVHVSLLQDFEGHSHALVAHLLDMRVE